MTQPVQCRLEDDQLYAVKGRSALAGGLLAEVCAGQIGRTIGLPIPDFAVARVSPAMLDAHADPDVWYSLGNGLLFASLWQDAAESVTTPALAAISKRLLAKIYVFDHWISNGDRTLTEHGGNSNLLLRLSDRNLVAIDHNLAFIENYDPAELRAHACRPAWREARRDMHFRNELEQAMRDAMSSVCTLVDNLPAEWLDAAPTFVDRLNGSLDRIDNPRFWEELE